MNYIKLTHNSLTAETYFISPEHHSGALLGGWWYAVPFKDKMLGVPSVVYSIMPPKVKADKKGDFNTDLESIRALGREMLGDRNGTRLKDMKVAPDSVVEWLRGASSSKAVDDYASWDSALEKGFGKRKFVEMPINVDIIYS